MWFRGLLLCAAMLSGGIGTASAAMRISEDRGGQIGQYLQAFAMLRASGETVIIDGNCLSACTLVLGLIPRERICVTPRARLGFHAAWMPDTDGRPVTSPLGTQALWDIYPTSVRRWINRNGGLSRKMIFLHGRDLTTIVASCEPPATRQADITASIPKTKKKKQAALSHHRETVAIRPVRYQRAASANDRH